MTITEHFTGTGWADSCAHHIDETTAGNHEQLAITGESAHYTTARCVRCGEWVTLETSQETLI